jgi:nitrate reductase gamma subunit
MDKYTYFWSLIIISMAFFFIGAYRNVVKKIVYVVWLNKAQADGQTDREDKGKATFPALKTILNEAIVQSRIKERSQFLWLRHFLIFLGFVLLFVLDGLFALTTKYYPIEYFVEGTGRGLLKLGLELTGAILFVGLTLGLVHRLIYAKEESTYIDLKLLFLLWLVVATGFLTESFRLVLEHNDPYLAFSFIGGPLSKLLCNVSWPWEKLHSLMWMIHATVTALFFAYLPFSKFVHIFASPIGRSVTMAEGFVKQKRADVTEGLL